MFYADRVVDISDDLPKWAGMQDKSKLIEGQDKLWYMDRLQIQSDIGMYVQHDILRISCNLMHYQVPSARLAHQ